MSMIPYAGYDPSERVHWRGPGSKRPSFEASLVCVVMDLFDRGFDSMRIAALVHQPEHAIVKAIRQGREARQ